MNAFSLAWRNVWRNGRRSAITIAAMSLALLAMTVYSSLMEGMLRGSERNLLDLEVGDVQVFALDFRDSPSLYDRIGDAETVVQKLESNGLPATSRMLGSGLLAFEESSAGVNFRAIDIERDARVSKISTRLASGSWLDENDPNGVVIGQRLARILGASVGSEVIVVGQAADGSSANELLTIRGVLSNVGDSVDRTGVFMVQSSFRELFAVHSGAHQLVVRRAEGQSLAETADMVRAAAPELDVVTWRELMPIVASMLDSASSSMIVMMLIVYMAIGIVILNAMLMAVFERIREFGVLKAIGVGPLTLLQIIMFETILMTGCALVIGLAASVPALWYFSTTGIDLGSGIGVSGLQFDSIWLAVVEPKSIITPVIVLVVVVVLATLYPALRAAWLNPLAAIRHQ